MLQPLGTRLLATLGLLLVVIRGQYVQNYMLATGIGAGGGQRAVSYWSPSFNVPPQEVVEFEYHSVVLEYNCDFMRAICENAVNWINRNPAFLGPNPRFAYDFNTRRRGRSKQRRQASCPTGIRNHWASFHACPEGNQQLSMRNDLEWWTADPESSTSRILKHLRQNNNVVAYSKMRYSCDEFPPATWVEGGTFNVGQAETRCAAMRCKRNTKAEQDWQASAHLNLRYAIEALARFYKQRYGMYSNFDNKNDVAFFYLNLVPGGLGPGNGNGNGVAARVLVYDQPGGAFGNILTPRNILQARGGPGLHADSQYLNETDSVDFDYPFNIHVNESVSNSAMEMKEYLLEALWAQSGPLQGRNEDDTDKREDERTVQQMLAPDLFSMATQKLSSIRSQLFSFDRRSAAKNSTAKGSGTAAAQSLDEARRVVDLAIEKSAALNMARYQRPLRNNYNVASKGSLVSRAAGNPSIDDAVPPLLEITDEIAHAAALVSEADAGVSQARNVTVRDATGSYWMESLARKGTIPWGKDSSYKVFRNVRDFGAKGDGVTDDTKAIKEALNSGKRCGVKCHGSTTKNAIVYFPPGTYRVSTSIPLPFGTQVIGDASNWPTIQAAKNFIGLGVLSTDEYTGGGVGIDGRDQEWFVNTANFYRQIRNLRIDVTATRPAQGVSALHYQVAQATSLQNLELIATKGTKQRGIFAENGSGGVISDITFRGGGFGLYGGNQQFTAQRLKFEGCDVGVQVIWDWGWVWKSISMKDVGIGFKLLQEEKKTKRQSSGKTGGDGNIGSASFVDSSFTNVETAVLIAPPNSSPGSGSTGVLVENVKFSGVSKAVADTSGKLLLAPEPSVAHWALGPVYDAKGQRKFSFGEKIDGFRRQATLLDSSGAYFERPKPQYADQSVADIVHVKDFGAVGDGSTDDTAALQNALYKALGKILFVDSGSYIITSTILVPPGSRIVGEAWSQLVARGSFFEDAKNPRPMLKVGSKGDVGDVELQDLLFTNIGATAGLIHVEWNIRAKSPGSAALWDCHVRVGGALGTRLTPDECPPSTTGTNTGCSAGSLMLHVTSQASGYFENMWLWVSDHMIDDLDLESANNTMIQNSVYVARGFLIESKAATWMYGTSSEHATFYQYNFHGASNIFAGMIQTESPYYQPTPKPPEPFKGAVGVFPGDPSYNCRAGDDFSGCDESWGVVIRQSSNIFIAGAGIYSWFSTYSQNCIDSQSCQKALILLEKNHANVRFQHLITIGAKYMAVQDGRGILATDNLNVEGHPKWSQVSVLDVAHDNLGDHIWVDPKIWDMDQPAFTCTAPCTVQIPPWTHATSVIDFPIMTVSSDSWTTRITAPPMTISEWVFDAVTLHQDNKLQGRQEHPVLWPKPATTPFWPSVEYVDPQGNTKLAAPSQTFPNPPPSIETHAPLDDGHWPTKGIQPILASRDHPTVEMCSFWSLDADCMPKPWLHERSKTVIYPKGNDDDPGDERGPEDYVTCPDEEDEEQPVWTRPIIFHLPNAIKNIIKCIGRVGIGASHAVFDDILDQTCDKIGRSGQVFSGGFVHKDTFDVPLFFQNSGGHIDVEFEVARSCNWTYTYDECMRYMKAPIDSCDCSAVSPKNGGALSNNCISLSIKPRRGKRRW